MNNEVSIVMWLLAVLGIVIIAGLSVYAGLLLARLRAQNKALAAGEAKRNNYLHESIHTIALAMQQDQCPLSEGCIRIAVLLDNLPDAERAGYAARWPAIHEMHDRIKHMPTHDARKEFPKKEIRKMDLEREGYEVEMEEAIQADVATLLVWVKERRQAL
ncbi:DUF2489 domain-containing protein [Aliidiomarina haloalkalitolerans]|uniref:DUF2489 domain-containing protein n=2 Tax=Aliidiomarina haloalkalitolerans TaxID=859059 RepID=A0A432VS68_9GAMM|nr:DUF2489 domain-containing protein [Aliidiomarina haloalkalitolerans]